MMTLFEIQFLTQQDLDKLAAQLNELGVVSGNEPPNRPPRAPTNGQGIYLLLNIYVFYPIQEDIIIYYL